MTWTLSLPLMLLATTVLGEDVPSAPYMAYVYRYADTMLAKGRDVYGPQKSGLFLSALDRTTLAPLEVRPAPPIGVRREDRVGLPWKRLIGANPQHDQNLLRVLYVLSTLSKKDKYQKAADEELSWFLNHAASPETGLLSWGEHMYWNTMTDEPNPRHSNAVHEFFRPWVLWDRCFELAPDASKEFALGLWEHQIATQDAGGFDRHATYWSHGPRENRDYPRHAGFFIRTWADAYAHTQDPTFLTAIDAVLRRYERKRHPDSGLIPELRYEPTHVSTQTLSMAIDCAAAARRVPDAIAARLRAFVDREDETFCSWPHFARPGAGFVVQVDCQTGLVSPRRSPRWEAQYGGTTTAMIGMMCVSRYEASGKVAYRDLLTAAADGYLISMPSEGSDAWPVTFGHAISLQLAAWRATARREYLERARELGLLAIQYFFQDNPLPRASMKTGHYETLTGADSLVVSLLELHLASMHITAALPPDNTIDR